MRTVVLIYRYMYIPQYINMCLSLRNSIKILQDEASGKSGRTAAYVVITRKTALLLSENIVFVWPSLLWFHYDIVHPSNSPQQNAIKSPLSSPYYGLTKTWMAIFWQSLWPNAFWQTWFVCEGFFIITTHIIGYGMGCHWGWEGGGPLLD